PPLQVARTESVRQSLARPGAIVAELPQMDALRREAHEDGNRFAAPLRVLVGQMAQFAHEEVARLRAVQAVRVAAVVYRETGRSDLQRLAIEAQRIGAHFGQLELHRA